MIRWPCFLLCNELLLAMSQASELVDDPDSSLWPKIYKNEYRRCAVIEAYDTVKHLMFVLGRYGTEEYLIVENFFQNIDESIGRGKFTAEYNLGVLEQVRSKLILLIQLILNQKRDISMAVNLLQALYENCIRELPRAKKSAHQLRLEGLASLSPADEVAGSLLFENAIEFPSFDEADFYRQVRRLQTILTSRDSMHNVPRNIEARRRIAFFSNSLFMNMPRAPFVEKMMTFSILTPYYGKEVIFKPEALRLENEDGISTIFYLQKIYEDEWANFLERMKQDGMEDDNDVWDKRRGDLRL